MVIVKVQIPLASSLKDSGYSVYEKPKIRICIQPISAATKKAIGNDLKAYFEATYNIKEAMYDIGKRVEDQEW